MKLSFTVCLCLCFFSAGLHGQSPVDSTAAFKKVNYHRIVGLNMSPLVTQLIPFNRSNPREAGPFLLRFKHYGPRMKTAYRFSLGVHLTPGDDFDFEDPQLNFAIGWEKRRSITPRWAYTRGFDFMFLAGDLNIPGSGNSDNLTVGLGPMFGLEYFIDRRISIGCEAVLVVGLSPTAELIVVNILPPVGIFLNHYF